MILPPNVRKVIDILNDHNREAFAVGGAYGFIDGKASYRL